MSRTAGTSPLFSLSAKSCVGTVVSRLFDVSIAAIETIKNL